MQPRDWLDMPDKQAVYARADYKSIVSTLAHVFPPEDVNCMFYESFFAPNSLGALCRFLDLPYRAHAEMGRQNETHVKVHMPGAAKAHFAKILVPQYRFCQTRFGTAVPKEWNKCEG